jgi:GMC oxidoreductase
MKDKAEEVRPSITGLISVECPPLAVMGYRMPLRPSTGSVRAGPAVTRRPPDLLAFDKYSSLPLLISAIREAIDEAANDDGRRRLFLVPRARVVKLHTSGTLIRRIACIEVIVNGQKRFLKIKPECAVVLALGAIESTRIALESFPTTPNPKYEKMGRNLTVHMRSNTTVQINRSAFESSGKSLPDELQTAAFLVRGKTEDGHFHLQVTAAADPNQNPDQFLFSMIPDIDQFKRILAAQTRESVAVTFQGCAETKGVKDQPIRNPALRWIDLSSETDEFGFRRAFVNLAINNAEARLWKAMDKVTTELARKLANNDDRKIQIVSPTTRDGLGTTYHESGTLWMGDDPATSVTNIDGRFHHIVNAYCVDQALFPTVGSANPTLTTLTLTRKIAEHIANLP